MKLETVDNYFDAARQMPLLVSMEEVKKIIELKGVTPSPKKSGWNLNSIIMTATTLIIASIAVWFWNTPRESDNQLVNQSNEKLNERTTLDNSTPEPSKNTTFELVKLDTNEVGLTIAPVEEIKIHDQEIALLDSLESEQFEEEEPVFKEGKSAWWPTSDDELSFEGKEFVPEKKKAQANEFKDTTKEVKGEQKSLSKIITLEGEEWFKLKNVNGDIKVETWNRPEVKMEIEVTIKARSNEDEELLLEDFDVNFVRNKGKIEVERKWDMFTDKGCNCQLDGVKIKTDKGEKLKIKKIVVNYIITLPADLNLELRNNYGDITIPTISGEAIVNIYQGKLIGDNIAGALNMSAKFSEVKLNDFKEGKINLYQSNIQLGASDSLNLTAKFSKVQLEKTNKLELYGYQSTINANGNIQSFVGNIKFGKFQLEGDISTVSLALYQSKFIAHNIDSLNINSSYSSINVGDCEVIKVKKSYQDKYKILLANYVHGKSQYSSIDLGSLTNKFVFGTYQGKLTIKDIKNSFALINIESKYTPVSLKFENDSKYTLEAKTAYSNLSFPENGFTVSYRDRQNQNLSLKGAFNAEKSGVASLVNLDSFQGNLELK